MVRFQIIDTSVVDPDPHSFCNLVSHPDPHQHQIKVRIRKSASWSASNENKDPEPDSEPDPLQIVNDKPKCMEHEPTVFEHFFEGLSRAFICELGSESRSASGWKVGSWSGSASNKNQDPHQIKNQNLDPHQCDKSNPDPHQGDANPQYRYWSTPWLTSAFSNIINPYWKTSQISKITTI
jgi:hypothetical protein